MKEKFARRIIILKEKFINIKTPNQFKI